MGTPFVTWMFSYSPYAIHREWIHAVADMRRENKTCLSSNTCYYFRRKCQNEFYGYLVMVLNSIGTQAREERFYLSWSCIYYGLSRQGLEILAQYGYLSHTSNFDTLRLQKYQLQLDTVRYVELHYK